MEHALQRLRRNCPEPFRISIYIEGRTSNQEGIEIRDKKSVMHYASLMCVGLFARSYNQVAGSHSFLQNPRCENVSEPIDAKTFSVFDAAPSMRWRRIDALRRVWLTDATASTALKERKVECAAGVIELQREKGQ